MRDRSSDVVTILLVTALILIIIAASAFYANIIDIRDIAEDTEKDELSPDTSEDEPSDSEPLDDSEPGQDPNSEPDSEPSSSGSTPSSDPSNGHSTDTPDEPNKPPQPSDDPEPLPVIEKYPYKKWTTLFYVAYDNSIGPMEVWEDDLHFLELLGTDDDINLVALVDQEIEGDCHVLIIGDGVSEKYPPSVIDSSWDSELNTGDSEILFEFLKWGVETFPADYYDFHIMDHGAGWFGACIDESSDNSIIRAHEFSEVYNKIKNIIGKKIDIISYDACFMASFEFSWEICDSVHYITGMQTIAAGDNDGDYIIGNFDIYEVWSGLKENPDWIPEEFAIHQVNSFHKVGPYCMPSLGQTHLYSSDTMSICDLSKMESLKQSFSKLSEELYISVTTEGETQAERQLVFEVIGPSTNTPELNTESFAGQSDFMGLGIYYFYDLGDFVDRLIEYGDILCNKETAEEFKLLLGELVVENIHGDNANLGEHPDAQGVDIYLPFRNRRYDPKYDETKIAQDTLWDEFLQEVPWELYE